MSELDADASPEPLPEHVEAAAADVVDAVVRVHAELGPGLLVEVYRQALAYELSTRGVRVRADVPVTARYRGVELGGRCRLDLLVEEAIVVHVVARAAPAVEDRARLATHLEMSGNRLGFLVAFHAERIQDGIHDMFR